MMGETIVQSEAEAAAAIKAVAKWLDTYADENPDLGEYNNRSAANIAREFCEELLHGGRADGHGGCPLCQA